MTSSVGNGKEKTMRAGIQRERAALKCYGINKRFGTEHVIKKFNLTVNKGQLVTIFAPEFSGKSTLAKIMCGLLSPSSGYVLISGYKAGNRTNKYISYLPEIPFVKYDNTVYDLMGIYTRFFQDFKSRKAYTLLKSFKINPRTKFDNMSTTAIQLVETIMVASRKTSLYIFDEPIVNVNDKYRQAVVEMIAKCKKEGAVVVLSQEPGGFDKVADKVLFLRRGDTILSMAREEVESKYFQPVSSVYKEVYK